MKQFRSAVKYFFTHADILLLTLCLAASVFGVIVIGSATHSYNTMSYVYTQCIAIFIGVTLFVLFSIIDIEVITDRWRLLFLFNVLFILTLLFWGVEGDTGNKSWLRFFGFGIQPSEVVKISFTVLLAKQTAYLKSGNLSSIPSVAQLVLHFLLIFGLILVVSADLGSALVYLVIFVAMLFTAGLKLRWFIIGVVALTAVSPVIWNNLADYQKERIMAPYDPTIDPSGLGVNWQPNQSKIAIAAGKFTGMGLYNGSQSQSDNLPFKHTDFIFAVIGEELGMLGCIAVILLLLAIIIRCVYVGLRSNDNMGCYICIGFAAMLLFQSFENIGMCIGITPVIGLTLPFFSYGGSSIVTLFAAMGIVSGIKMRPKPKRRYY